MRFADPPALLLLPLVCGLIALLYLLKPRRRDVIVSSTFLWQRAIREAPASAPFQKLRANLFLFLQLLIAALLAAALARPYHPALSAAGRSIVLVVDTSVSMRATDVLPSRLETARQEARRIAAGMGESDRMLILSAARRPEALTGFTSEKAVLYRAIDSLKPHDTPANMQDALQLASDLTAEGDGKGKVAGRIELISDGSFLNGSGGNNQNTPFPALAGLHVENIGFAFHPLGVRRDNVGIVGIDYRRKPGQENGGQALLVTHNFSAQTKTFNTEIYLGSDLYDAHEITLPSGGEHTEAFDIAELRETSVMHARLDIRDDLDTDNEAWLVLRPHKRLNVLLVGRENLWLENALRVDADVALSVTASYPGERANEYDVVVFNENAPPHLPPGNYLFLHCTSDQCPAVITPGSAQTDGVAVTDTEREHPILHDVDAEGATLNGVYRAAPLAWGREIASGGTGALIVAGERKGRRTEFAAFSLDKSTGFMLTTTFPIFISSSVHWLGRRDDSSEPAQIRTGTALTLPLPAGANRLTVTKPDGSLHEIAAGERGEASFDDVDQAGLYRVTGTNYPPQEFAANLASMRASDIMPHNAPPVQERATPAPQIPAKRELLPYFALTALLLLCAEWYLFHRRPHLN